MIGMIIFYLITTTSILLIGLIFGKQRRFQKDNLDKAVRNAYDDGKLFSEIAAHNEKVLRKKRIIK